MLIYLDQAMKELHAERDAEGRPFTRADLQAAIMLGAVERVRPKMMTVTAIMAGLIPDSLEHRHGLGSHAAHRRAYYRRHDFFDSSDACCHSGGVRLVKDRTTNW